MMRIGQVVAGFFTLAISIWNRIKQSIMRFEFKFIGPILLVMIFTVLVVVLSPGMSFKRAESPAGLNYLSPDVTEANDEFPGCRYGVNYGSSADEAAQIEWLDDLATGWHVTFESEAGWGAPSHSEFVPLIWVRQRKQAGDYLPTYIISPPLTEQGLGQIVDANPGSLWIVGNEVDRGPGAPGQGGQGDMYPDVYAQAYHDVYHFLKDRDPSALVANSGLVEITPGRLQYLDLMWSSYLERYHVPMPVDVWNMHLYILPEVTPQGQPNNIASVAVGTDPALGKKESYDPDGGGPLKPEHTCPLDDVYCYAEHDKLAEFDNQVKAMRRWMVTKGQRHKPLILSEFSQLYPYVLDGDTCWIQDEFGDCFAGERVLAYMDSTFNYLTSARDTALGYPLDDNRLVQQWSWYSIANLPHVGYMSDLVTYDDDSGQLTGLTTMGTHYKSWAQAEQKMANLLPDRLNSAVAFSSGPGGTAEASLAVWIGNNGNVDVSAPFSVTFYADSNLSEVIGSTSVPKAGEDDPGFPVPGCARRTIVAESTWSGLAPGLHPYWVAVDSEFQIPEADESDNIIAGYVFVDPDQVFLPRMAR